MKMFRNIILPMLFTGMGVTSASAATIASPTLGSPVSATGTLTFSRADLPNNPSFTCSVGLDGWVSSSTPGIISFASGDIWGIDPACALFIDIDLPVDMVAVSSTTLRFSSLRINTPAGLSLWHNVDFTWSTPTATLAGPRPPAAALLTLSNGTLTLSPAITIVP